MEQTQKRFALSVAPSPETHLANCIAQLQFQQENICASIGREYKPVHPKMEEQLSKYILQDPSFIGDLKKGIILIGSQGRGKTILMEAFCKVMRDVQRTPIKSIDALELQKAFRRGGQEMIAMEDAIDGSPLLFLDDISEEVDIANNYGSKIFVGYEVLSIRHKMWYNRGFLTFATTNSSIELLGAKYGPRIESRISELFNAFHLDGDDLRQK